MLTGESLPVAKEPGSQVIGATINGTGKDHAVITSHALSQGRYFNELARKHNRIIQHGTQSRSTEGVREGIEFEGNLLARGAAADVTVQ